MKSKWIKNALKQHKKGALHKQLEIPQEQTIPVSLLIRIKNAKLNSYITGTTKPIKITRLLKRRAILALNLKKMHN